MEFQLMQWSGVWVGGCPQLHYIATSWLHLASGNLPDFQLCCASKMLPGCAKISWVNVKNYDGLQYKKHKKTLFTAQIALLIFMSSDRNVFSNLQKTFSLCQEVN